MSQLPIQAVLPELLSGVRSHTQLIVKAAPGAGKSTYFPLQLLLEQVVASKIIMLEPRRLAARNIARYLAEQLGEEVGQRVGYRVRGENKVSANTQLEIVTEGVMTRMIQTDPELTGIDMIIFDEFHERSIHADTALALSLEIQEALREDLKLIVMSATLDQHALMALLPEANYVESEGRAFAVEKRYLPLKANDYFVDVMARQITSLMSQESGSLLAFLPGVGSIHQVQERLTQLASDIDVCPLHGQLNFKQQQQAIQPAQQGRRKVVLATNIAETSLTIEGIRIVVDSGLERVAKFDLKTGVTKLEQVRIAQSSAEQRAGRAGRIEEGICVRLYSESQLNQQPAVPSAEINHSDLSGLAMELAQWGCVDPSDLCWLDVPPAQGLNQARQLLQRLGLMDDSHQLTPLGQQAQQLGGEPRSMAMLMHAKQHSGWLDTAIAVAALIEEPERNVSDLLHSVHRFKQGKHSKQSMVSRRAQALGQKLNSPFKANNINESLVGLVLALAYPDRLAQNRGVHQGVSQQGKFILANGHGVEARQDDPMADQDYLIAIDLMRGRSDSSLLNLAVSLDITDLQTDLAELFIEQDVADWDESKGRLVAEQRTLWGRLIIARKALPNPPTEKMTEALLNFVRRKGLSCLNWTESASELVTRIRCASEWLPEQAWPNVQEQALLDSLEEWLAPYLVGVTSAKSLNKVNLTEAINAYLGWPLSQEIDQWLPTHYRVPTGSNKKIRYQTGQPPVLSVRMQEMFGEQTSPTVALGKQTVVVELLSPAQRPLQLTSDLASFWSGAYSEVKKEMKGRYPKHVWPDDPANHEATSKTKRQLHK
ncbi:ATP-dependent helicase HrpB [Vibrio sp. LaRot3]|uniref:ATP-dependent helicase HrpB n=1 Tax=Vibrio sp. LaRot3 TaxID=2998829 RepID=UPI0022CDC083|nr:ATP-dependent helicase HrpB [Vibrio sp. LaRot3]MDA0148648.1 ATP-dependent helicase HrpB [Vibrio sp. LaRot3]